MITLTLQFLIIAVLPLSILITAVYVSRADFKRPSLRNRWLFTLLAATLWASSLLRLFGGTSFSPILVLNWSVLGRYALLATALGVLWTTQTRFGIGRRRRRLTTILSLLLALTALALDAQIWRYAAPDFSLAGRPIRFFDLWAAVWVAAWVVPLVAAWLLTQQVRRDLPLSFYRNQTDYWLLALGIFFVGFGVASIQQPGQPVWQEVGILLSILAILVASVSLTNSLLPNLRLAIWQVGGRLAAVLIIFVLAWVALLFARQLEETRAELTLVLLAALLALAVTAVYRIANTLTGRALSPAITQRDTLPYVYSSAIGHAPEPVQLGQLFLRTVQFNLGTDDAWLFLAQDASGGQLVLRPLTYIGSDLLETAEFRDDSPFTQHLRREHQPILQVDLDTLELFTDLDVVEKAVLLRWQRVLYMPLHARDSLIGVLALGPKYAGEAYSRRDFALLEVMARQISPLLVQAQNMATLRRLSEYAFQQNRRLMREQQQLQEVADLQAHFIALVAPELQRPFARIFDCIDALPETAASQRATLSEEITALKTTLSRLINLAARVDEASRFALRRVQLEEVTRSAMRQLRTMADARRVELQLDSSGVLPVLGDAQRLQEALEYLLHNAIKFNRIGGRVLIDAGSSGGDVYVRLRDTGVGIPPEKLETLWNGFPEITAATYNQHTHQPKGVGLIFARFIIVAHGGRLEADSNYGAGSTFTIYLPAAFTD